MHLLKDSAVRRIDLRGGCVGGRGEGGKCTEADGGRSLYSGPSGILNKAITAEMKMGTD